MVTEVGHRGLLLPRVLRIVPGCPVGGGCDSDDMTWSLDVMQALSDGPEWQARAACADLADGAAFLRVLRGDVDAVPDAIAICRRCPVSAECWEHATTHDERVGVWGGVDRGRLD